MNGLRHHISHTRRNRFPRAYPAAVRCLESLKFTLHLPRFLTILAPIFMVDGILLGLALADIYVHLEGVPFPRWFDLTQEFAFGEIWEYCLTGTAALILFQNFVRFGEPVIATLSGVFAWLTFDNMLALHERSGELFAPLFSFASATAARPQDFAELVTLVSIGALIFWLVLASVPRSSEQANIQSLAIVLTLAGAAGFGVAVDFVHQFFPDTSPLAGSLFSLAEDGGELVLISVAAALAFSVRLSGARRY